MSSTDLPVFSATDRIKQLNTIDKDITKLLRSAGLAVKALTTFTSRAPATGLPAQPELVEQQKESFKAATSHYFTLLSSLDVNLRRQIYALEEADILSAESISKEPPTSLAVPSAANITLNASSSKMGGRSTGVITSGGLGNLDVGWLNSRNDNVGSEMNAELWEQAYVFVSKLEERNLDAERELNLLNGNGENGGADVPPKVEGSGREELS